MEPSLGTLRADCAHRIWRIGMICQLCWGEGPSVFTKGVRDWTGGVRGGSTPYDQAKVVQKVAQTPKKEAKTAQKEGF